MRISAFFLFTILAACGGPGDSGLHDSGEGPLDSGNLDSGRGDSGSLDSGRGDSGEAIDAAARTDSGEAIDAALGPDSGSPDGTSSACAYFSTIDRRCTADSDCLVRIHQIDCCGTTVAFGIHSSAASEQAASEAACQASYPRCGCPARPPTTDTGETFFDSNTVMAACIPEGRESMCRTYLTMRPAGTP